MVNIRPRQGACFGLSSRQCIDLWDCPGAYRDKQPLQKPHCTVGRYSDDKLGEHLFYVLPGYNIVLIHNKPQVFPQHFIHNKKPGLRIM